MIVKETIDILGMPHDSGPVIMRRYGITAATVTRWVARGLLPPGIRYGRTVFYPRDEVDARTSKGE